MESGAFEGGTLGLYDPISTSGCDRQSTAYQSAFTRVVARSISEYLDSTSTGTSSDQEITMSCSPDVSQLNGAGQTAPAVYEDSEACRACQAAVFEGLRQQHALEEAQWNTSLPKVRLPIDSEARMLVYRLRDCMYVCKACVLTDVTQNQLIDVKSLQSFSYSASVGFKAHLSDNLRATLLSSQDSLSSLADHLGINGSVENLTTRVTSLINEKSLNRIVHSVGNDLNNSQVLSLKGSSYLAQSVTQNQTLHALMTALSSDTTWLTAGANSTIEELAKLVQKQNTLDDAGQLIVVTVTTLADTLSSLVGKIFYSIVGLIGLVALALAGYVLYHVVKQGRKEIKVGDLYLKQEDATVMSPVESVQQKVDELPVGGQPTPAPDDGL